MATFTSDPLVAIGYPGLTTAPRLAPISLPTPAHLIPTVTEEDVTRVRGTLALQRTSSPLYREPSTLKRNKVFFRNKEKIEAKADPKNWDFTPHELGKALEQSCFPEQGEWPSLAFAKALLEFDGSLNAELLWEHAQDPSLKREGSLRRRLTRSKRSSEVKICVWLERAVQRHDVQAVVVLCQAAVSQASLDRALELALRGKAYGLATELLRFNANLPVAKDLYERALSDCTKPDHTFVSLWMSSPGVRHDAYARDAMRTAARTGSKHNAATNSVLSVLLEHVAFTTTQEVYEILLIAIKASNLEAIAMLYAGVNMDWIPLVDDGIKATALAVATANDTPRYSMLHFCFLAGATPDTDDLRRLLLRDVKAKRLKHVAMLVHYGVSPCHAGEDVDALTWAVQNAELSILPILMNGQIPSATASSSISQIPSHASDDTQTFIVDMLCRAKGATGQPLSCLLLRAVKNKHQQLISSLLKYGATSDFTDGKGQTSLHLAIQQGDINLAARLCAASPTIAILSDALPLAYQSFGKASAEQLEQVLTLLVSRGARGSPLEQTVALSIASDKWKIVFQVLLPVGMTLQAWGRTLEATIKADNFDALSSICRQAREIPEASLEMALTNILSRHEYHPRVVLRLAKTAKKQSQIAMLNRQLVNLVRTQSRHQKLATDTLLKNGASVSSGDGIVLVDAVAKANLALLKELIALGPDSVAISAAFEAALRLPNPSRLLIIKLLNSYGIDQKTRSECLLVVACLRDIELLTTVIGNGQGLWEQDKGSLKFTVTNGIVKETEILLQHKPPRADIEAAFDAMLAQHHSIQGDTLKIANLLLQKNLGVNKLNAALLTIFQRPPLEPQLDFVNLLLRHGAHADVSEGQCFATAATLNSTKVFQALGDRLFDLPMVLQTLINYHLIKKEEAVVKWAKLAIEASGADRSSVLIASQLLKLAIERFPKGEVLVRILLAQQFESANELGSVVVWALQSPSRASDEVIIALLSRGDHAKMKLTSGKAGQSATHLAASSGRTSVLKKLIDLGIRIDTMAYESQTPLNCATMQGHSDTMLVLLKAESTRNDGSMHIAARNANTRLIQLLRSYDHDINWPMDTLEGRTPLAELCYSGQGTESWASKVEGTMELLLPSVNRDETFKGRRLLHLAIDNSTASAVVLRAFLRASRMHRQPDRDEQYLYFDKQTRLYYSPGMYTHYLCANKSRNEKQKLLDILESAHFKARYFAPVGEKQPNDATGFSKEVEQYLEEQRKRDEEQKRRDAEHKAEMARLEKIRKKEMEMIQQKADVEAKALARRQDDELAHLQRLADLDRQNKQQDHTLMIEFAQDLQNRQRLFREEEERRALKHENKVNQQTLKARKEVMALEDRRIRERRQEEELHVKRLMDGAAASRRLQITNGETYPGMDARTTAWQSDEEVD